MAMRRTNCCAWNGASLAAGTSPPSRCSARPCAWSGATMREWWPVASIAAAKSLPLLADDLARLATTAGRWSDELRRTMASCLSRLRGLVTRKILHGGASVAGRRSGKSLAMS
ncbi:Argininosuccinate synthase [Dorcoceras hygrometricum]|uniref:Argininosuccinate synthase n=1 Tax=Dorcoceras hygrometricum TaxID=472368 RepID=A0A2Z6ZSR2_9LAMI|nr:Argininosuccinate synthase [Dorcoceras hygrometricum]